MCTADRREHATDVELDVENPRREVSWTGAIKKTRERRHLKDA